MRNEFKVNKKQWNKWSDAARHTFNSVYNSMRYDYDVLYPAKAQDLPVNTLRVMAWNVAWIAADSVKEFENNPK